MSIRQIAVSVVSQDQSALLQRFLRELGFVDKA